MCKFLAEIKTTAAALYDGGWRASDHDELLEEMIAGSIDAFEERDISDDRECDRVEDLEWECDEICKYLTRYEEVDNNGADE